MSHLIDYHIQQNPPLYWDGESPYTDLQTRKVVWTQEVGREVTRMALQIWDQEDFESFYPLIEDDLSKL